LKIILTTHQFLPDFFTGTETLTYETAKELQRRSHQVEIWTGFPLSLKLSENKNFDNYLYDGIFVQRFFVNYSHSIYPFKWFEFEYNNAVLGEYFRDFLKNKRPDLVHSFHLGNLSASLITECVKLNIPVVFTSTDFWFVCPKCQLRLADNSTCSGPDINGINCLAHMLNRNYLNMLPGWLLKFFVRLAEQSWWPEKRYLPWMRDIVSRQNFLIKIINDLDMVLVPTDLMKQVLMRYGLELNKIRYVPYGINLSNIKEYPLKSTSEKVRLGFIGTIAEHKGVHVLLEAVHLLPKDFPIEIYIYGKLDEVPEYTERLKEIAGGDERIHFCGIFPNHEIGFVFSQLDCLIVPSLWHENAPLVVYSAQATNTPVIASDVGGLSEIISHEINGLLFEKGNVTQLADLIMRICEDRVFLSNLSSNVVHPRSIPAYVDELEEIYKEVLSKRVSSMMK